MEQIHGIDVSWMTHHGPPKDKLAKTILTRRPAVPSENPDRDGREGPTPKSHPSPAPETHGHPDTPPKLPSEPPPSKAVPPRPGFTRSNSNEKSGGSGSGGAQHAPSPPARRGSWFSSISQKFAPGGGQSPPPQPNNAPTKDAEISVPKVSPAKNAVLQHAVKFQGDGPYTPAPPKNGQNGIFHVFRRLSSSGAGQLGPNMKALNNHGLVERKVLNVDHHRERCPLSDLNQAKLRRVAFCVDVEIAPMPRYAEADTSPKLCAPADKKEKRKLADKGEGEALKHPKAVEEQKEQKGVVEPSAEKGPCNKEPENESQGNKDVSKSKDEKKSLPEKTPDTKKKEKKKKSEEERKARKEKKRKLAEANGQVPLELHLDSDLDSSDLSSALSTPRTQAMPTTNPVRIYRRCCQLRETPILKKITEQLTNHANTIPAGVVERLDLTGYWMQLPDLVTLGDYLAVVPIKEVVLENCGLTDEGLRVILAGLLAAKGATSPKKRPLSEVDGLVSQGGIVERLVVKNNKIGPEGWKHMCLFVYMCRSLKSLDLSGLSFPKPLGTTNGHLPHHIHHGHPPLDVCKLLSKSIGERLAGSTLELLNFGETGLTSDQLGCLMDGILKCGVRRLGLAHLNIDAQGLAHIKRYLGSGTCEGLDLGGNDLRDSCEELAGALPEDNPIWALSLAECNLKPASLCKLLPQLVKLHNFRFIDLSHNQDLFTSDPSAVGVLRRYLPKMRLLKRIHLSDCALKASQAIALAEVIPEMPSIAHINFLENPELSKLADAKTEESQEEASALYASLLAAARVSRSLVCVDVDVPTEASGEIVRALAKHVVAYCLRNMEHLPIGGTDAPPDEAPATDRPDRPDLEYPDVLQHLVGHDVLQLDEPDDEDVAPDDDYIVGGTGVAKALACCLDNRGGESRRQSGEFIREVEAGIAPVPRARLPGGKAKDVSKHLLLSARKIRHRLEPALIKAKGLAGQSDADRHAYHRLMFLQNTLDGIIKRFEDEFPETREQADSAISVSPPSDGGALEKQATRNSLSSADMEPEPDGEDDLLADNNNNDKAEGGGGGAPGSGAVLPRTNSNISLSSKALADEEARVLRAGHRFRAGWMGSEHFNLLSGGAEAVGRDPKHARLLTEMIDELGDPEVDRLVAEKGVLRVFEEDRGVVCDALQAADPVYWARFIESQEKARANIRVAAAGGPSSGSSCGATGDGAADGVGGGGGGGSGASTPGSGSGSVVALEDEVAVAD